MGLSYGAHFSEYVGLIIVLMYTKIYYSISSIKEVNKKYMRPTLSPHAIIKRTLWG